MTKYDATLPKQNLLTHKTQRTQKKKFEVHLFFISFLNDNDIQRFYDNYNINEVQHEYMLLNKNVSDVLLLSNIYFIQFNKSFKYFLLKISITWYKKLCMYSR